MNPAVKLFVSGLAMLTLLALAAGPARAEEKAVILAGGCFWCVEADFDAVDGVLSTTSGYIGGSAETANYKRVTQGDTGHYEAVRIVYDPEKVSYEQLLYVFWRTIDPTDPDGQFCDRGSSYKTGIFVANEEERKIAEESKAKAEKALGQKIVTPIVDAPPFYDAEGYHQDYYTKNPARYNIYRYGCRRDARIEELWGEQAHAGTKKK